MCAKAWRHCVNVAHPNTPEEACVCLETFQTRPFVASWRVCVLAWLLVCAPNGFAANADMAERTRACTHCHGEQGKCGPRWLLPTFGWQTCRLSLQPVAKLQTAAAPLRLDDALDRSALSDDYLRDMAVYFSRLQLPYPPPAWTHQTACLLLCSRVAKTLALGGRLPALGVPACAGLPWRKTDRCDAPMCQGLLGLPLDYINSAIGRMAIRRNAKHMRQIAWRQVVKGLRSDDLDGGVAFFSATKLCPQTPSPACCRSPSGALASQSIKPKPWRCGSSVRVDQPQACNHDCDGGSSAHALAMAPVWRLAHGFGLTIFTMVLTSQELADALRGKRPTTIDDTEENEAKVAANSSKPKGPTWRARATALTCHTQAGWGEPYAGGRVFDTPFRACLCQQPHPR